MTGHNLHAIPVALSVASTLRRLALVGNQISSLSGLLTLPELTSLDVSLNRIPSLEPLPRLPALQALSAAHNCISRADDLNYLRRTCSCLTNLDLRGNAMTSAKTYSGLALRRLPRLVTLDGATVSHLQRQAARNPGAHIPVGELLCHCSTAHKPAHLGVTTQGVRQCTDVEEAHGVVYHSRHLRRLDAFQNLPALKWVSLVENEISSLQPLHSLVHLTHLNVASNLISDLSTASQLTSLKHIDLDHNRVTNVAPLAALTQLTALALESNSVGSLSPLGKLTNLVELYVANNRVKAMRDIKGLQDAKNLLILDLRGNSLCNDSEYSGYMIYKLFQLLVLDGEVISAASVAAARAKYAGRLTLDFLEEKAGIVKWSRCVLPHAGSFVSGKVLLHVILARIGASCLPPCMPCFLCMPDGVQDGVQLSRSCCFARLPSLSCSSGHVICSSVSTHSLVSALTESAMQ
jgi:Leucine-rich repeat (LRR) protein